MDRINEVLKREDEAALPPVEGGRLNGLIRKFQLLVLLDDKHPYTLSFFPSRLSARHEKRNQFFSKQRYMIHPFSKFSIFYDIYLIILYLNLFIFKGLSFGFLDWTSYEKLMHFISFLDVLSLVDILINFHRGYTLLHVKRIELRRTKIALHYIKSPYFICDFLSSIPMELICCLLPGHCSTPVGFCLVNSLSILRLIRIITFIKLIKKMLSRQRICPQNIVFMVNSCLLVAIFTHWVACLHYAIPRYGYFIYGQYDSASWVITHGVINRSILEKYIYCYFKISGYTLGIDLKEVIISSTLAEDISAIIQYVVGKICLIICWLILLHIFLLSRSLHIKYHEIINQVEIYMSIKQFPLALQKRIIEYYKYKYQGKFFNEASIYRVLSFHLKQETKGFARTKFIASSRLFEGIAPNIIEEILSKVTEEIYMPGDVIIQIGTESDGLYFLSEGTVAIYSKSGSEVCHLYDGAHFGEISLLIHGQQRNASVVAIEICSLLKLGKKDFRKCFMGNAEMLNKLYRTAGDRLTETLAKEEQYKQWMFQKLF